jgi:hypothetical protein
VNSVFWHRVLWISLFVGIGYVFIMVSPLSTQLVCEHSAQQCAYTVRTLTRERTQHIRFAEIEAIDVRHIRKSTYGLFIISNTKDVQIGVDRSSARDVEQQATKLRAFLADPTQAPISIFVEQWRGMLVGFGALTLWIALLYFTKPLAQVARRLPQGVLPNRRIKRKRQRKRRSR